MLRKTITFRQIFIAQTVLLVLSIMLSLSTSSKVSDYENTIVKEYCAPASYPSTGEYQIYLEEEGISIYDGERYVESMEWDGECSLQAILLRDNQ